MRLNYAAKQGPKPMYYQPAFSGAIAAFEAAKGTPISAAMPNDFIAHTFPGLMAHRRRATALAEAGASPSLAATNAMRSDTALLSRLHRRLMGRLMGLLIGRTVKEIRAAIRPIRGPPCH